MAPPSKKGKGKAGGKGKNKKGKNQETSGNPVEPPPVQQQEQPSQPQVETEPQPAQSHEAESNPSIDSVPESPQNPEPVSEPESPQPVSEQASTALENLDPPQTSTNPDEDGSLQVASPDAPPDQQQILNDVQNILEATHESILEELAAPELPAEIVEATHEPISDEPAAPELPTESAEVTHEPISEEPVAPEPLAEIIEATHESILEELAAPEPLAESVEATPEPISEEPAAPEPVAESIEATHEPVSEEPIAPEPLAEIIEATHESILEELAAPEPVSESVEATHEPTSEEPAVPEPPAESVEVTHEPSAPEPLAEIIEATHESILEELAAPEPLAESHEPTAEEPVAPEPLAESVEATREPISEEPAVPEPPAESVEVTHEPSAPEPLAEVIEATHESILEELAAPEPLAESVEANVEKVNGLGDTAEPPEPTPVTAPQTPLLPTAATSIPPPSPSLAEAQHVAETLRSNAGSPTPNHFSQAEAGISVPQQEPTPPTEQATSPAADPASPLKPVLPPALPAAFSGPDSFTPALPAAPKPASPATQFASPVYQPASPAFRTASLASHPSSPIQRPESPQYRAPSPAYRAASPAQKTTPMAKAISKAGSPLVHAYMSPAMSPHAMPPPPPPSMPPSIPPGYVTAYSPVLSSAGYLPPYAPYYHQPSPNILPAPRGSIDPHYASTFQALRDMGLSNGNSNGNGVNEKGTISPPHEHDEPIELLQRIQDAIPDINRLLTGYRNTKSKLAAREAEFKQMQSQHEQALMHKDFYIEALQNQMRKAANESAEETTRLKNNVNELRMELGNLDEKRKDLEENLAESEKFNKELLHVKADLEGQVATLTANMREAQEAHEKELERREEERIEGLATQKQELTELFEEIKAEDEKAAAEALAAREKELLDQQESMRQQMQDSHDALQSEFDAKVTVLESTEAELASTKEELGSTIAELDSTKTELDGKVAELEATQTELSSTQTALEDKQKELDETREQNANEIAQLKQSHEETVTELETRITEKCAELAHSEQENKKLEEDNLQKEKQLEHAVGGMRTTIDNLGKDCDRLRKTLHSIGEATDLKSTKGDTFFLDCFDQLSRLIVFLSKEHFTYLPIDPPKDVLSKIPPELPSFLDNTPASRELRSAYVQHVISKTLTYRIFQPFLFTLGRRYDKADTFFQMLSMDIRRKSVRREAFWRQQTLKAAYTTSDAKQSINVVAAVIVDEIIDHIKHFADPRHLDTLLIGVRKIVKLAAETWRLARVERELILATLPAPDAEGVSNDGWSEYGTPKEGSLSSKDHPSRHVILRTFPQIAREAAHEDFAEDEEKISPCVYSRGVVLYSDSPVVMARLQELAKKSTETLSGGEESPRARSRGVRSD